MSETPVNQLSHGKLLEVIRIQTEIGRYGMDLANVKNRVVESVLSLVGADGAAIKMADGDAMVYESAAGIAAPYVGLRLAKSASLSGTCLEAGVSIVCDDARIDPRVDARACQRMGVVSMIVIPLAHQDIALGVLKALAVAPSRFNACDVALLELVSGLLSSSMYFAAKYSSEALFQLATHDGLTGLVNRSHFMDRLANALVQVVPDSRPIVVLVIDMDGLKWFNDTHGHRVGDAMLREFGKRLQASIRVSDTAARMGGDEFAVLLKPLEHPQDVPHMLCRIEAELAVPFEYEGATYPLRASIGFAQFPEESQDAQQLLELADQRMYAAKRMRKMAYQCLETKS